MNENEEKTENVVRYNTVNRINQDNNTIDKPVPKSTSGLILAGKAFLETAQTILISFAITGVIYLLFAIPNQVEGASMETTFHNGDLLITNKFIQVLNSAGLGEPLSYEYQRGDVIIFQQPQRPDFIKRIIAKEGDTIMLNDEKVIVNGQILEEKYLDEGVKTILPNSTISFIDEGVETTVPKGKYFAMGDNREHSQDSRFKTVGWIDESEIKGRVFLKYWPLLDFHIVTKGEYSETPYEEAVSE